MSPRDTLSDHSLSDMDDDDLKVGVLVWAACRMHVICDSCSGIRASARVPQRHHAKEDATR